MVWWSHRLEVMRSNRKCRHTGSSAVVARGGSAKLAVRTVHSSGSNDGNREGHDSGPVGSGSGGSSQKLVAYLCDHQNIAAPFRSPLCSPVVTPPPSQTAFSFFFFFSFSLLGHIPIHSNHSNCCWCFEEFFFIRKNVGALKSSWLYSIW